MLQSRGPIFKQKKDVKIIFHYRGTEMTQSDVLVALWLVRICLRTTGGKERSQDWDGTEMARTRWPLHQAYPRSWSVWTSESGKAEEKMDKHHLARSHQPEPHTSQLRWWSRRLEKNQCGWPLHLRDLQPDGERDRERKEGGGRRDGNWI